MVSLTESISKIRPFRVIVIGDLMLDELLFGDADRLSNDAPVPVLHVRRSEHSPGGAANVCLNLVAMGASVSVLGVTGKDEDAAKLRAALKLEGVETEGLIEDESRPTTVKRSLIGLAQHRHPQKMFRVDFESREPMPVSVGEQLLAVFDRQLAGADVVCIEDYNKGVCTEEICQEIISRARAAGKPVLVDPASVTDYTKYRGATCITPNRTEAEKATGLAAGSEDQNNTIARKLLIELDLENIVVTLDRHGALLLERGSEPIVVPTVARQVYDVTGAGDVFLAGLAAGRANGLGWTDAARLANVAAGIAVESFGAVAVPIERVHQQVLADVSSEQGKLRTIEQLLVEVRAWRRGGKRIVLTNGCFDVLHAGHVSLLDRAKRLGDVLIVATNTDERVREFKGPNRPVNGLAQRAAVLSGLAAVDAVVVFEEETPREIIERIGPDVLAKGDEYEIEQIPGASFVIERGGTVERLPMVEGYSTTAVLRKMGDERAETSATDATRARFVDDRS